MGSPGSAPVCSCYIIDNKLSYFSCLRCCGYISGTFSLFSVVMATVEQVVSLYNYQAQRDDELSFPKGCTINILNKDDRDWWKGEFNGKLGMFPANYVTPLASKDHLMTSCMFMHNLLPASSDSRNI